MSMSDLFSRRAAGRYVNDFYETEYIDDNEQLHRDDGPAYIDADGNKGWYRHGQLHRAGGLPAVERVDGKNEYWENGKQLTGAEVQAIKDAQAAEQRRKNGQNVAEDMGQGLSHAIPALKKLHVQQKQKFPPSSP
jgi:hypothetical protein